jgi:putative ABC transport system permease protein
VIIANAVALSTIERRREIGLLKAVGAKASWVVVQLALENTLLGFVGGLIGLGIALAALLAVTLLLEIDLVISPVIIIGVLVLSTVLSLVVTLLSAYPAAQERPLDILRGD